MRFRPVALIAATLLTALSASAQTPAYTVRGTVQETGATIGVRPLQGAEVRLTPGDYRAVTDASGTYVIANVPRGTYAARISAPEHLGVTTSIVVENDVTLNYQLVRSENARIDVAGYVTESGSFGTRTLQGATVRFEPGGYAATSDASGRFHIANVLAGTYRVTASAPGHRTMTRSVVVPAGQDLRINLPVGEGSADTGTGRGGVIRSAGGAAISGATIRLTPGNVVVTTGSDGSFDLPALRRGTYMLHVKAPGYVPINRRVSLPLSQPLELTLRPVGAREDDDDDDDDAYEDRRHRDDDDDDDAYEERRRHDDDDAEQVRERDRDRIEKQREEGRRIEKRSRGNGGGGESGGKGKAKGKGKSKGH